MRKIIVDKELLYKLYIEENKSIGDVAISMGLSYRTTQRAIKEFGFNKDIDEIQKQRKDLLKEKYGVENTYQLESVKEKSKQTKLEKYGDKNYNNIAKQQQTMEDRYGIKCGYNLQEVQDKIREKYGGMGFSSDKLSGKARKTMLDKYNTPYALQNKEIKNKAISRMKATTLKKYGVACNLSLPDLRDRAIQTNIEKYGVPYFCMKEECYGKNGHTISKVNKKVSDLLIENNISNTLEFKIDKKSFDIIIDNTNILLEVNPTYTHNSTNPTRFHNSKREPLDKNYHIEKTKLALDNGYRCVHIFDWDNLDKIVMLLKPKLNLYARKCTIKEISVEDTDEFLNKYHLQNTCKNQSIRLGLYYKDRLVQVMTFGKPRYNKKYEYELLRLCSDSDYNIVGGSSKLFNYFVKNYSPKSIISYCDNSKFNGDVYKKLGFNLKDFGVPSKHWFNGDRHITDNLLRQRGYDQLFGTDFGKGTSNEELMVSSGFVEVYDSGQSIYVWNK